MVVAARSTTIYNIDSRLLDLLLADSVGKGERSSKASSSRLFASPLKVRPLKIKVKLH